MVCRNIDFLKPCHGGQQVYNRRNIFFIVPIDFSFVGNDPGCSFPVGLSSVVFTGGCIPAMIGGQNEQPVFFIIFLSVSYGICYFSHLLVKLFNGFIHFLAVSMSVPYIVGML